MGEFVRVDTYRAEVARAVIAEGVSIINDISGLEYDPGLGAVAAARQLPSLTPFSEP